MNVRLKDALLHSKIICAYLKTFHSRLSNYVQRLYNVEIFRLPDTDSTYNNVAYNNSLQSYFYFCYLSVRSIILLIRTAQIFFQNV